MLARVRIAYEKFLELVVIVLMIVLLLFNAVAILLRQHFSKKTRW